MLIRGMISHGEDSIGMSVSSDIVHRPYEHVALSIIDANHVIPATRGEVSAVRIVIGSVHTGGRFAEAAYTCCIITRDVPVGYRSVCVCY